MHELIANDWLDHDYIERHTEGWPALRERALHGRPSASPRSAASRPTQVRALARDYGTTQPAAIRLNYGMQRVRGGGNAVRLIAILPCLIGAWRHRAGGLLLSSSGWFRDARDDAALQRPDLLGGAPAAHDQHEHDRRRPAARAASRSPTAALRPEDRGARRLQQQPGRGGAASRAKVAQGFAREDLFTVVLEHFMTDTADHADYVLPATTQLEHLRRARELRPHLRAAQRAGDRAARRGAAEHARSSASWRARMGFDEPCFADERRGAGAQRLQADGGGGSTSTTCARTAGVKLDIAEAPFADGGFPTPSGKCRIDAPGLGVPDHVPNYESAASTPALARALSAGDDLAAGAQLPQLDLRQRQEPARHRRRAGARDRTPTMPRARGIAGGQTVRVFNDRGEYRLQGRWSAPRARPGVVNGLGVWWRKLGARRHATSTS